jgi:hypothetical protein
VDWWSLFARSWPGLIGNLVGNLGGFWSVLALPFSVGDRPGNCLFHWVFWELAPFFEDS